jgi:hypothetical protein
MANKYNKPTLGRKFNVVNCSGYIDNVINDLTRDIQKLSKSEDITIDNMNKLKHATLHINFLVSAVKRHAAALDALSEIQKKITTKYKSSLDELLDCKSEKWADIAEFEDLKSEILSDSMSECGDAHTVMKIQKNKDSLDTASSLMEYLPQHLDIEGIYTYEQAGAKWRLPKIRDINNIPPMFYYFEGDALHKRGVYFSPSPGIFVEVPHIKVIPENISNSKHRTAPCKGGLECPNHECTYAHPGTPYMKVGISARCPKHPGFGDKDNYASDIKQIYETDARLLLLYSITDLFPLVAWMQQCKDPKIGEITVLKSLEICEPNRSEFV